MIKINTTKKFIALILILPSICFETRSQSFDYFYNQKNTSVFERLLYHSISSVIQKYPGLLWSRIPLTLSGCCTRKPRVLRPVPSQVVDNIAPLTKTALVGFSPSIDISKYKSIESRFAASKFNEKEARTTFISIQSVVFTRICLAAALGLIMFDVKRKTLLNFAPPEGVKIPNSMVYISRQRQKNTLFYCGESLNGLYLRNLKVLTFINNDLGRYPPRIEYPNSDNVRSQKSTKPNIKIYSPLSYNRWNYLLCILIGLIFISISRVFIRITHVSNIQLARLAFFINIYHKIKTHVAFAATFPKTLTTTKKHSQKYNIQEDTIKKSQVSPVNLMRSLPDSPPIDDNNRIVQAQQYDIVDLVKNIITVFNYLGQQRNIQIDFKTYLPKIFIWFDRLQIEKVFYHLMTNAFMFIENGKHIEIEILEVKQTIQIRIVYDANRIADKDRIRNHYFQVHEYEELNAEDAQTGFSMYKRIIASHMGTLEVESRPKTDESYEEIRFVVTLPKDHEHFNSIGFSNSGCYVPASENRNDETETNTLTYREAEVNNVKRRTIFVVEGNREQRLYIAGSLKETYNIFDFSSGAESLKKAIELIPDVIVIDAVTSGMDGFEVCRRIKNDVRTNHIPVILLTDSPAKNPLNTPIDQYICKPFSIAELELKIQQLVILNNTLHEKFRSIGLCSCCKNIFPDTASEAFITKMVAIIEDNISDPLFGVQQLSRNMGISRPVLYRKTKAITGMSINDFSKRVKFKKAGALLLSKNHNVNEVSEMVGFSDRRYFSKEFKKMYNMTPSVYIKNSMLHSAADID